MKNNDMYQIAKAVKEKIAKAKSTQGMTILSLDYEEVCIISAALNFFQTDNEQEKEFLYRVEWIRGGL